MPAGNPAERANRLRRERIGGFTNPLCPKTVSENGDSNQLHAFLRITRSNWPLIKTTFPTEPATPVVFQSTRPHEGRDPGALDNVYRRAVSIHAPPRGARRFRSIICGWIDSFNPRAPTRGATMKGSRALTL